MRLPFFGSKPAPARRLEFVGAANPPSPKAMQDAFLIYSAEGLTWIAAIEERVKSERDHLGPEVFEGECRQQITDIIIPAINAAMCGMENSGYARLSSDGFVNIVFSCSDNGCNGWLIVVDRLSAERYGPMLYEILSVFLC